MEAPLDITGRVSRRPGGEDVLLGPSAVHPCSRMTTSSAPSRTMPPDKTGLAPAVGSRGAEGPSRHSVVEPLVLGYPNVQTRAG